MKELTIREAINEALDEEMARDEKVFILGEDVGVMGGAMAVTRNLYGKYGGKRVMDTPISESAILGGGLGAALTGLRPVVEIMFIDFFGVCMDQVLNQISKVRYMLGGQVKVPLVIRTQGGAGKSYAAQHSQSLESWFVNMPGIKVVMPSTSKDAKGLLKASIREDNPVIFIEHKFIYNEKGEVPEDDYIIELGKADVKREGKDITIIAWSRECLHAIKAADILEKQGIDCEIVDPRTLDPLDMETIGRSVKKTGRALIVEEGYRNVGVGAEISSRIQEQVFDYLDAPVQRLAAMDTPIPFNHNLEKAVIPQIDDVVRNVKKVLGKNR